MNNRKLEVKLNTEDFGFDGYSISSFAFHDFIENINKGQNFNVYYDNKVIGNIERAYKENSPSGLNVCLLVKFNDEFKSSFDTTKELKANLSSMSYSVALTGTLLDKEEDTNS